MKKAALLFIALFGIIYWFTGGLMQTFFQQDEWNGFGLVIQLAQGSWIEWFGLLSPSHFIPLSQFFWFVLYKAFGFQSQYFAFTALFLHALASYLVYILATRLTKNPWTGVLTAILFATNFRAAQAFTHLAIFPATITGYIIILLFLIYLAKDVPKYVFQWKDFFVLFSLFITSMLLREDGLILPGLLIAYLYLFNRRVYKKQNVWFFVLFFSLIFLYICFRVTLQLTNPHAIDVASGAAFKTTLYNAVSLPIKLIVQNLFEGIELFNLFWLHKARIYPEYHHQITVGLMYTVVYDFVMCMVFAIVSFVYAAFSYGVRDNRYWNILKLSLVWIVGSAGLLSFVGRPHNVVESRYLYLTSLPVYLMLSQLLMHMWQKKTQYHIVSVGKKLIVFLILTLCIWWSYVDMQFTIARYRRQSVVRQKILADLTTLYPVLPDDAILYVRCKQECTRNIDLVGVPNDLVLPFTSGPGWIFLLQYAKDNEKIYAPFFSRIDGKEFLWDYAAEGYRKIGEHSFGYFITYKLLLETLQKEKLDSSVVIGLEYDDIHVQLRDDSEALRKKIDTDVGYGRMNQ